MSARHVRYLNIETKENKKTYSCRSHTLFVILNAIIFIAPEIPGGCSCVSEV